MLNDVGKQKVNTYLKCTSIALQMALIITAVALCGRWLDNKTEKRSTHLDTCSYSNFDVRFPQSNYSRSYQNEKGQ